MCDELVTQVCTCLRQGGVVALATDTLYGLASTLGTSQRLFQIKSRDTIKPVAICVADVPDVYRFVN